jgi:hypothetical protein
MHVKPRVGPGQHALRRLAIHEFPAHEQPQHRPLERRFPTASLLPTTYLRVLPWGSIALHRDMWWTCCVPYAT